MVGYRAKVRVVAHGIIREGSAVGNGEARKLYDAAGDGIDRLSVMELLAAVSLERGELDDAAAKYDTVADSRSRAGQADLAARAWAAAAYATALRGRIATDGHAPGNYRAMTVRNMDEWYKAFDVKEGDKLYLAPDKRVKVW